MAEGLDAYHQALKMTSGLLRRNSISEDAGHYVNEAYLQLAEAGKDISAELLYNKARGIALGDANKTRQQTKETMKVCPKCKEEYPINFFGMNWVKRLGRKAVNGWCKKCKRKCGEEYRQRNRDIIKEKSKKYDCAAYPKYSRKKQRDKARRSRENLYDGYIRNKLRQQGWKNEEMTPELVEQTRQRLLAKRARVKKSRTHILASVVKNHS